MNPQIFTQPLNDYNINDLSRRDGLLETIPLLSLDIDDKYIIQNLHRAIEDSANFYDDVNQFNLKNKRLKNEQMLQGKHLQEHKLYRHQTPYIDNEMYVGTDAIIAYVTAQTPKAEVYPASEKEESKILATNLESYLHAHSEKFELAQKLEGAAENAISKYIGILRLRWDPNYGQHGEIIPEVVDPNHVIIDKDAKRGENPRFICYVQKATIEQLIARFPDKEKDILRLFTIKRKGAKNTSAEIAYREVAFTYYDKKNKPQEAICWYVRDLVLDKRKDPNWLYKGEGKNFLDNPAKMYIPINIKNDGSSWIDKTSSVEQAVAPQEILNKLGRQIVDNLGSANGFKILDSNAMSKDDAQNFTGDPNQLLLVKTKPGQAVKDVIEQMDPQIVSEQLINEKSATRQTIHDILGTPSQFTGSDEDQSKTASQAQMIKNQASGRQDKIVRAIDSAMDRYFKLLTQMITVWYTDTHMATINGGDGNFDFIEMHQNKVESGMTVRVQSGTTLPFDKARQEAVAQNAAELELLAPFDYYRLMHMENPQKLYDNLVKWKTSPEQLAVDVDNNQSDDKAIIDFTQLMAGKKPEQREDPTVEYIEQMRKSMISDEFLKAKKSIQNGVVKFVKEAAGSLAIRTELDQASSQQPPPQEPMPPFEQASGLQPPAPGTPPPTAPGQPPMPPGPPGGPVGPPGMPPMPPGGAPPPPPGAGSPMQAIMGAQPLGGAPLGAPPPGVAPSAPSLSPTATPQVNTANPRQLPPF